MTEELNNLLAKQPILLFDGECGFCNHAVQFVLRWEKKNPKPGKELHFAAIQSREGQLLRAYFEIGDDVDSIILIKHHAAYIKSCAALRLTQYLRGFWPVLSVFILIPPFLRNAVYDVVAKRRQRIAGRVANCALLQKEEARRFLDRRS